MCQSRFVTRSEEGTAMHARGGRRTGGWGKGGGVSYRNDLVAIVRGELVDEGGDHAAGATPGGPEVHQHRHLALQHQLLERLICHCARVLGARCTTRGITIRLAPRDHCLGHNWK